MLRRARIGAAAASALLGPLAVATAPAAADDLRQLHVTVSADAAVSEPAGQNGYTVAVANPNGRAVMLVRVKAELPDHGHGAAGENAAEPLLGRLPFAYVPGTTSGVTTRDPSVLGRLLLWRGPWALPAHATVALHFRVRVSGMVATYYASATASAERVGVLGARHVAPIAVVATGPLRLHVTPSAPAVCRGGVLRLLVAVESRAAAPLVLTGLRNGLPRGFRYVHGSTSGLTGAEPERRNDGHVLHWSGPWTLPPGGAVELAFAVRATGSAGSQSDRARVEYRDAAGRVTVLGTGPTAPVRVVAC